MTSANPNQSNMQHVLSRMAARGWAWRPVVTQSTSDGLIVIFAWPSIEAATSSDEIDDAPFTAIAHGITRIAIDDALDEIQKQMAADGHDPKVGPDNAPKGVDMINPPTGDKA